MKLMEGKVFVDAKPDEVIEHLRKVKRHKITAPPEKLFIFEEKEKLFAAINGMGKIVLPLRKSFVYKLLRWYNFPLRQLDLLNADTVVSILNDYLLSIKSPVVHIKIEDGEALTIVSERYTEIDDLYLLETFKEYKINAVTRDDFMMRIYSEEKEETEIFDGDKFKFGFNIVNSETGFSALSVYNYVLRLVCTNGMLAGENLEIKKFHYGYHPEELKEFVIERIARTHEKNGNIIEAIRKSKETPVKGKMNKIYKRITFIAGKKNAREILAGINENSNLYDLINSITNYAHRLNIRKRFELEEFAGKLILN